MNVLLLYPERAATVVSESRLTRYVVLVPLNEKKLRVEELRSGHSCSHRNRTRTEKIHELLEFIG